MVTLPHDYAADAPLPATPAAPRVVLVDDATRAAHALHTLLVDHGYTVETRPWAEALDTLAPDALAALLGGLTHGGAAVALPLTADAVALAASAAHLLFARLHMALSPVAGAATVLAPFINQAAADVETFLAPTSSAASRAKRRNTPRVAPRARKASTRRDTPLLAPETPETPH